MSPKVHVELNQQQEELLDRLVSQGAYGATREQVLATVFSQFRREHPEVLEKTHNPSAPNDD